MVFSSGGALKVQRSPRLRFCQSALVPGKPLLAAALTSVLLAVTTP